MLTDRDWSYFERWEDERSAKRLLDMTHARALASAEAMYEHALRMSPETVGKRPQSREEWLSSDDIQTMMRVRKAFGTHVAGAAR